MARSPDILQPEVPPSAEKNFNRQHALLAPGQGNQKIGMGLELAKRSDAASAVWRESDRVLLPHMGFNFSDLVWNGTPEQLKKTEYAQPAIIIDAMARKAALQEFQDAGVLDQDNPSMPYWNAGLSLGFIVALVNAGSLSVDGAVQLGEGRGRAFKYAVDHSPRTTMVALIDVGPEIIAEAQRKHNLEQCLLNTDSQVVLGGQIDDVRKAEEYLKTERGIQKIFPVDVDAAFHSKYMEPAVPIYEEVIRNIPIEAPKNGVVGGSRVKPLYTAEDIRTELVLQLTQTERWKDVMRYLRREGVVMMTELNDTPRLTNMNREMFGGLRPERLATPGLSKEDRGVTIAQRWKAA